MVAYQRGFPAQSYCGHAPDFEADQDLLSAVQKLQRDAKVTKVGGFWIYHPHNLTDEDAQRVGFRSLVDLRQRIKAAQSLNDIELGARDADPRSSPRHHRWDVTLPELDLSVEWVADYEKWDESGHLWGRDGHWPLFVAIGGQKHYSKAYHANQQIRQYKTKVWKDSCASGNGERGAWPWWIEYSGEPGFWREGRHGGGEWDGRWWFATRAKYTEEEIQQYEAKWNQAHVGSFLGVSLRQRATPKTKARGALQRSLGLGLRNVGPLYPWGGPKAYGQAEADRCITYCQFRQARSAPADSASPAGSPSQ